MPAPRAVHHFLRDETASMTVEFVAIMGAFIFMTFLVIEVSLAFFWWKTAEKATQLGVRVAAVSTPVTAGVPATNAAVGGALNGTRCANAAGTDAGTCASFNVSCGAGTAACSNATELNRVLGRMKNILGVITTANVRISYQYVSMGYVGGPTVPLTTVTLSGVPFRTGLISMIGQLLHTSGLATIPPISARVTGEDLSTAAPP